MTDDDLIKGAHEVRIAGLPKGTVLWPTAVTAIVISFLARIDSLSGSSTLGYVFLGVFTANLLILYFEFGRGTVVAIAGLIIGSIFGLAWLSEKYDYNITPSFVGDGATGAEPDFYLLLGLILLILIVLGAFVHRKFHYFILGSNELVAKTGILGDAARYNAPQMSFRKEKPDIFESFLLLGSGRLTLVAGRTEVFVIDNVPRIDKIEEQITEILGKLDVV